MNVVVVIQARMNSSRFPGKVMASLGGKPLIDHVLDRTLTAVTPVEVMVATSKNASDDVLAAHTVKRVRTYRGSERDVLDRYHGASLACGAEAIVRVTADCPLVDPSVIDAVVNVFLQGEYDYVSNTIVPTFPDGLDVEVFGVQALDRTWREALLPSEREHVTPYIWNHPADFRLRNFFNDFDLSHLRWTVDEPIDLVNLQRIFDSVPNAANLHMRAIMEGVASMSQVAERESLPQRNEGYMASLLQDSEYRRNGS